mgnify:CR=1 FL=1
MLCSKSVIVKPGSSGQHTKLSCPLSILRHAGPVIRPGLIPICAQRNHRLDRKAHSLLRRTHSLVLAIMRNIRRAMEQAVDTMSTVRSDNTTLLRLAVLLDNVSIFSEQSSRLDGLDSFI